MVVDVLANPAVYAGPAGWAYAGYKALGRHNKRRKAKHAKREAEARANLGLLQDSVDQGGSFDEVIGRISRGFQGKANQLPQFLEQNRALLATSLLKTDAAKDLQDTNRFMGLTYAPAVGNIESGIAQATRAGAGGLSMSGLSASGASPALAMNARLQGGAVRGGLYSNLMSQHLENRYNLQADVASLALGFAPAPRESRPGTDYSGYLSGIGSILGAALPLLGGGGGGGAPAPRQGYKQAPVQGSPGLY